MAKNTFQIKSLTFITLISLYFAIALNVKFWQMVCEKVEIHDFTSIIFAVSLPLFIFVPLFIFFNLIIWPRIAKPIVALLLFLSAASNYALQYLGIIINTDMVRNFFETNAREAGDLITLHAVLYVLIVGIVPAILVCKTDIKFSSLKSELCSRLLCFLVSIISIMLFASVSYKGYVSLGRNNKEFRYYINTVNYIYAMGRYYKKNQDAKREFVILDNTPQITANSSKNPRVTVLIVGETARSKNFSLYGYERQTNPLLSQKNDIVTFKKVTSCGTATAFSLPCMFSYLNHKNFDVTDAFYMQNLMDIAEAAGYHIVWVDNDDGCKNVCKRVKKYIATKKTKSPFCYGNYCHDDVLLDNLDKSLAHISQDTLIVLHSMGSHGPTYFKRYPKKFEHFKPICNTADLQNCTKEQIVNTYDNTIVYTDYIIASVIDRLKQHKNLQTAMLYVSDHGESLGGNNLYLHGLPYAIAPAEQKEIPMILWLSKDAQNAMNVDYEMLKEKAETGIFSHDNYFHSVLRLLFIESKIYNKELDIFNQ